MTESGKASKSPGLLGSLSEGWKAHTASAPPPTDPPQMPTERPDSPDAQPGSPFLTRYRDAYRVGAALVGIGNAIKVVGAILAGFIVLVSLSAAAGPIALVGIVVAAIVGGLLWICGVIVAAQGQILQPTLDNAVASSPFLSDHERADAMALPQRIADRVVGA